jgi:hypothetical protein
MDANLTVLHIYEYIRLWMRLEDMHLHEDNEDAIVWNLTYNGDYSSAWAYDAKFFKATLMRFNKMVWKAWNAPKVKFFSWLSIWNEIWTVDHLERIGWDNCGLCPLCKQTQEKMAHLFSHFHYSKRLWENGQELACPNPRMDTRLLHRSLVDYDALQSKAKS